MRGCGDCISVLIMAFLMVSLLALLVVMVEILMLWLPLILVVALLVFMVVGRKVKKSRKPEITNEAKKQVLTQQNPDIEIAQNLAEAKNTDSITNLPSDTTIVTHRPMLKIRKPNYVIDVFNQFVALDFETTGLDFEKDKIIEIAALRFKDKTVVDKFVMLVNPQKRIPPIVVRKTGINNAMVKDKPTINEVLPRLLQFIGEDPIVAHNASFDLSFLKYNVVLFHGKDIIRNPVVDTLELSKQLFSNYDIGNYRLETVAKHIGINVENLHRAEADAYAAAQIYLYWCEKWLRSLK